MATTLCLFDTAIPSEAGHTYSARACGRQRDDSLWEGWIEFEGPAGEVLRSGRETTQPNLMDLRYWAQGLTPVYLQGALKRSLEPNPEPLVQQVSPPAYSGPTSYQSPASVVLSEAVLDPYLVYEQGGAELLLEELSALSPAHLRQIVRAYRLVRGTAILDAADKSELITLIREGVEHSVRE